MTDNLTPEGVAKMLEGVTPSRSPSLWRVEKRYSFISHKDTWQVVWDVPNSLALSLIADTVGATASDEANARFVAYARSAVPALAAKLAESEEFASTQMEGHGETIRALKAAEAKLAEVEARAVLDGIAMTETAMARDRAMTNLEHWRQEVGKLHSQIAKERDRAKAADAEVARLREALTFYADISDYPAPLTGGMGKLWQDCGETARAALQPKETDHE
jgi:hypothetical protein